MLKRMKLVTGTIVLALLTLSVSWDCANGQTAQPKIDPMQCEALQSRLDEIVAVSRSTGLSEQEKMAQLSASLSQSLATMIDSTRNDPDAAKIAKEWKDMLMKVMSSADVSGRAQETDVSADAKRGVDLIKKRIQPYIAVMKLMCPDLVVPVEVSR
ncbi:MAG: hypothetical protein RDU20_19900 [Desulfomonilaceae bacterium]|nr:hypothetical protein [Desulfomonilaceae bacterium]